MLYFSSQQVDIGSLDVDQLSSLRAFQKKMQKVGLTGSYRDINDFKEQLASQISINVNRLLNNQPIPQPSERLAKDKAASIKKIMKEGKVYMEDYEKDGKVKSFLVKGDTKEVKENLKELGGKWNQALRGWIFPKSKELEVADFLKKNA